MFQSITKYLYLIGDYTNPAKIIWNGVSTAIGSFVLMVLVIILLRKLIFVKRRFVFLKVLAIIYVIVIPILTGFLGFKLGLVNGLHTDLKEHLPNYTKSLDAAFSEKINEQMKGLSVDLTKTSAKDLVDTVSTAIYGVYKQTLDYKSTAAKDDIASKASVFLLDLFSSKGISMALKKGITKLVEKTIGIDEDVTSEVMSLRLNELLKSGLLTKIVEIQIDKFFKSIKTGIYILFAIMLIVPATEVFISLRLYKKRQTETAPAG
jgi:hypothetical protein